MVVLDHITTNFGKRIILDDVTLKFKEKTITAITGKSGAGKTTLLGIISGLQKPNKGKVFYKGKNIIHWGDIRRSKYRNREIGFVFQFFNLLPDMTSYQNIVYPARISLFQSKNDIDKMARELVHLLDIDEIINNYPTTLSGGERQRVAIARAIINRPRLILADEPTGNLDDQSAKGILALFRKLRDEYGMTIIVVTHDSRIMEMSDVQYHLLNGKFSSVKKERGSSRVKKTGVSVKRKTVKKASGMKTGKRR
jgi:ABC-type lipoprotein export system ATPase subunit